MLHLKAVDDVIRFRARGSSFHNTAAVAERPRDALCHWIYR